MRTRLAVLIIAGTLAITPACRGTKDRPEIRNTPVLAESARDAMAGNGSPQKILEKKVLPAQNVTDATAHQADVIKVTPRSIKKTDRPTKRLPEIEMIEPGPLPDFRIETEPLPFKGSR